MPSATRNTNTNNGNDASAPANPNTYLNSSELMPRAAPKDSTTVATRISGAVTARSRTIRTSSTTSSTIGMITRLSRWDAFSTSSRNAVAPPTSASEPGTACTALRACFTAVNEAGEEASLSSGAAMNATPYLIAGWLGSPRPGTPDSACATSAALSLLATIMSGADWSDSPCAVSTFCPTIESNSLV